MISDTGHRKRSSAPTGKSGTRMVLRQKRLYPFNRSLATWISDLRTPINLPPPLDQLAWIGLPSGNADTIDLVRAHGKGLVL